MKNPDPQESYSAKEVIEDLMKKEAMLPDVNEKEIKLPTDSIERLYVELYKLLHMEYLKALVDEL